jgi:hypothetical protein
VDLGRRLGLSAKEVNEFMPKVQWSESPLKFCLEGQRPVRITIDSELEKVRFYVEELNEIRDLKIPRRVRQYLDGCKAIVSFEMGISQLRTMHETIAFEVAYWLSEKFNGVILSDDNKWYDHDTNR